MATGPRLSVAPETEAQRLIIESRTGDLQLLDGRNKHNNGWFVVRSLVPAGADKSAIEWVVTPHGITDWKYQPVVHVSQVGYHPQQQKIAIIELDNADAAQDLLRVKRISEDGGFEEVLSGKPADWGKFLRTNICNSISRRSLSRECTLRSIANFRTQTLSNLAGRLQAGYLAAGDRILSCGADVSHASRGAIPCLVMAPVIWMMRVWHSINYNHFDGYQAGTIPLNQVGSRVRRYPGLNVGGWHDAGDDDLRIESQADEVSILATPTKLSV